MVGSKSLVLGSAQIQIEVRYEEHQDSDCRVKQNAMVPSYISGAKYQPSVGLTGWLEATLYAKIVYDQVRDCHARTEARTGVIASKKLRGNAS